MEYIISALGLGIYVACFVATYENALQEAFIRECDVTGRAMTRWVLVATQGIEDDDQL